MSALAMPAARQHAPLNSRPVIAAPGLTVVPSPAPRRGFLATVILCSTIFLGALLLSFYLNTRMVQGAYEIKDIKVELTSIQMEEEQYEAKAVAASSSQALRDRATKAGMVPAQGMRGVNVDTGVVTAMPASE